MSLLSAYLYLAANTFWLWVALIALGLFWSYMRMWIAFYDTNTDRTDDKTFIITGAESGIGKMSADLLAARGGRIIMACKDTSMGEAARDQIVTRTANKKVEVHHLDLSSLDSVRKFAKNIHSSLDKLDVLINNAATVCAPKPTTADGLNTIMQVNHFGPFLLTNLLLDILKKSSTSRIVFVSSINHHFHKFNIDNLNCDKETLSNCRIYCNSKLANILTTKYFARMLQGTGVCVNSVHPGMTKTNLVANSCSGTLTGLFCSLWISIFGRTNREGAMTSAYVATEPKIANVTGKHFAECNISSCVAKIALDESLQNELYEKSAQLVHLRPEERHI